MRKKQYTITSYVNDDKGNIVKLKDTRWFDTIPNQIYYIFE